MANFEALMIDPMLPVIADGVSSIAHLHKLWEAPDRESALREWAPHIQAIVTSAGQSSLDGAFLARFPKLKIIASFGVGYDHVDTHWAQAHGVVVTHTPDVLNEEVADTALGLILCAVRQLPQADRFVRAGLWREGPFPLTASLRGKTLGIFGLGRIGHTIAKRAEAFGLKVIYHGRTRQPDAPYPYFPTLVEMARACDILVAIAPGGAQTRHMVDAQVLEALGPQGTFINVARGSVVDQQALIAALREGKILTAGLDVFEDEPNVPQELIDMKHVVLAPHIGSSTNDTRNAMGALVVDNLKSFFQGQGPLTPIPETPWKPA